MSAAATAAGYLFASGRLRGRHRVDARQRQAERAAEGLKREREVKVSYRGKRFSTAPGGAKE